MAECVDLQPLFKAVKAAQAAQERGLLHFTDSAYVPLKVMQALVEQGYGVPQVQPQFPLPNAYQVWMIVGDAKYWTDCTEQQAEELHAMVLEKKEA